MKNWYWKTFFIVLAMTLLLWIIAIVAAKRFDFYITPNDGVITIIGVVAGFIVIGNYAQVHEMEEKYEKRIKDLEDTINRISDNIMANDNGQENGGQDTDSL